MMRTKYQQQNPTLLITKLSEVDMACYLNNILLTDIELRHEPTFVIRPVLNDNNNNNNNNMIQ
eukprot:UN09337